MNIVAEALSTASNVEMLSLSKKMSEISQSVAVLRSQIKQLMDRKYVKLIKIGDQSNLVRAATEESENIKELEGRVAQVSADSSTALEELRQMRGSLTEVKVMCDISQNLLIIDSELNAALADQNSFLYYSAATHINNVSEILVRDRSDLEFLSIYNAMVDKTTLNYGKFTREALKLWKAKVSWFVCQLEGTRKTSTLEVHKSNELLQDLLKTLNVYGVCEPEIYYFSQPFYKDALLACIDHKTVIGIKEKLNNVVLSLTSTLNEKPTVNEVLDNLTVVFKFIWTHMNLSIDETRHFISELGFHLADKFLTHLVEGCLLDAIPNKRQDLPAYEDIVTRIIEFHKYLVSIEFIGKDNDKIQTFCGNVEEQFLSKTIERYLSRAREISKSNLQDMTPLEKESADSFTVAVTDEPGSESQAFDVNKSKKEASIHFTTLPEDFGEFPTCHVSKNVLELMALVREVLTDCTTGDHTIPNTSLKLFCTARDCINLYVELSPVVHIKLLESLPQQSALFHNNCFYIAHELITLNEPYKPRYTDQVIRVMGTFVDMASYIRSQGLKVLDFQVTKQYKVILDIVNESGLSNLSDEDIPPMLEKSLRQCVYQLTFLQTMWHDVLPVHVYNKIIGQLCNTFLEEVITRVCVTKDIREATASHLVRHFGYVQECLPKLFKEPLQVHRHIKKWAKFTELVLVLNASLAEIGERWASGKGPLAAEFNAAQVRQLIKALFQVSDRRAAVLSRIK